MIECGRYHKWDVCRVSETAVVVSGQNIKASADADWRMLDDETCCAPANGPSIALPKMVRTLPLTARLYVSVCGKKFRRVILLLQRDNPPVTVFTVGFLHSRCAFSSATFSIELTYTARVMKRCKSAEQALPHSTIVYSLCGVIGCCVYMRMK